jgi:hypothetical protein
MLRIPQPGNLWYNLPMDARECPEPYGHGTIEPWIPARFVGLQGRLARPFWGVLASWSVLCGALASDQLRLQGASLLTLALVVLLAELVWGTLWDLVAGTDWLRPLAEHWPPARPARWRGLPYTRPRSPGGRMLRGLNRFAGWWRESFWPTRGPALLGALVAVAMAIVLAYLLPNRLRPLYAALVALLGLGLARRRRGKDSAASQALIQVGLGWMAGQLAFAEMRPASLGLALAFTASTLGMLKLEGAQSRGSWLVNGGQAAAALWLAALGQPLAAGAIGLLCLGQIALQLPLHAGAERRFVVRRALPWMMAAMLVAALAIP